MKNVSKNLSNSTFFFTDDFLEAPSRGASPPLTIVHCMLQNVALQ